MVSYKLMPADTAQAIIPLQGWRYDVVTPLATLHVLPQSFNRTDQIVSLIDHARKLSELMDEDPYIGIAKYNTAIVPRLSIAVLDRAGKVWERTGTWHVPSGLNQYFKPGEKPFLLRSDERELVAFSQPPAVDISFPDNAPA